MPQNVTRLALALSALAIATPAAATNVVASIKPVELLVKAVAGDSVEVSTLIPPGSSPHNYSMKPSQRRALEQADVIFWVGPDMETFLNRLLGGKEFAGRAVAFMESEGGESEHDEHHEEHNHEHDKTVPGPSTREPSGESRPRQCASGRLSHRPSVLLFTAHCIATPALTRALG